ncbi:MAG: T9SS type A sorting domain-containing protein [Candidatus Eisenbacteria bacterium]|nr:T9SS type A sorting domain-containing protein [Candidatus Eisenbacteria bacterium]
MLATWIRRTLFAAAAVALLGGITSSSTRAADGPPGYVLQWGTPGALDGEFDSPHGIAVDSNCDVYVVDTNNDRVQKFDSAGNFLLSWGGTGQAEGEFRHPIGIAVASNGDVYVVDTGNNRVQVFDPFGVYINRFGVPGTNTGEFDSPSHIHYDGSTVWVTDTGNARVQRFQTFAPYAFISSFGTFGSGPGQFQQPYGITGSPTTAQILVTDLVNTSWTQVFNLAGGFLGTIGTAGTGNGQFSGPRGLDSDSDSKIYVTDAGASIDRVQKFSPFNGSSTYLTQWGTTGSGAGEFMVPEDIAICGCYVFVTDRDNNRVQRFDNICISGMKWDDADQDGIKDISENGIAGWTIELRDGTGTAVETRVTNLAGEYSIMGVASGNYVLAEVAQAAWYQTAPLTTGYSLFLPPGHQQTGLDFGNAEEDCFEPQTTVCFGGSQDQYDPTNNEPSNPSPTFLAAISGFCGTLPVLTDYDTFPAQGRCFAETHSCWSDSCLVLGAEMTFGLLASDESPTDDTISFWQGASMIWSLPIASLPGAGGWSPGQSGVFTLDLSMLPPDLFGTTNIIAALQDGDLDILIENGTIVDFIDLAVETCCPDPAKVCGQKFHDQNCNGVWDAGEPPLANWEIVLSNSTGVLASQLTDANGEYCFTDLPPDRYVIHEEVEAGWTQTTPASVSYVQTLQFGQLVTGLDFGNVEACPDTSVFSGTFGNIDSFNYPPEPTNPGADLLPAMNNCSNGALPFYDAIADQQCFGETMTGWPTTCTVTGAIVCMRIRASSNSQNNDPDTDSFYFYENGAPVWSISLNNLDPDGLWEAGEDLTFCLDLANLPASIFGVTNILAALQDGDLDVLIQDDTGVDYMTIDVTYCCSCAPPVCCTPPPPGLCAWYPGDVSTSVVDLVSAPANGALIGNATYTPGHVGDAFYFDGDGDRVDVPNNSKLNPNGTFSVDAWVRADDLDAAGREVFVEKFGSANRGYSLFAQDGFLGYDIVGTGNASSAVTGYLVSDASWHLVVLTVSSGDVRLYVDGAQIFQDTTPGAYGSFSNNQPFHIGGTPTAEDFHGWIDEVEFFHRVLTPTEVDDLYMAGTSGKCRDTISTTEVVRCTPGIAQVNITAEICNYGASPVTYNWELAGLPTGTGCDVDGPTNFFPASSGMVTVNPGTCIQVSPILVDCPSGMSPGDRACWEFRAWREGDESGPCDLVATGHILSVGDDDGWEIQALTPVLQAEFSDSTSTEATLEFRIVNHSDPEGVFDYRIEEGLLSPDDWPVLSLDDLPTGEAVEGRLGLEIGQSRVIQVKGRFLRCVRRIVRPVILSQDLPLLHRDGSVDPGGALARGTAWVPVAAAGITPAEIVYESSTVDGLPAIAGHLLSLRALPTPFTTSTQLKFQLDRPTDVRVEVFDATGRRIRLLQEGTLKAGEHTVTWNGRNDLGRDSVSGTYFVKLWTPDRTLSQKVLLMR